jgi:hypothetical protein
MRSEVRQLQEATDIRIREITQLLANPEEKTEPVEETTHFEVLEGLEELEEEEGFEVMEPVLDKKRT